MSEREKLLTISEAAEYLTMSPVFVRRRIRGGELEALKLGPKAVRIRESEIVRYLSEATISAKKSG